MKKRLITFILLLFSGFLLFAQNERPSFYITDVGGDGSSFADNGFLAYLTTMEVRAQDFPIMPSSLGADYILTGVIRPSFDDKNFTFFLTLRDNQTGVDLLEQHLSYNSVEEVTTFFPLMMFNIFSNIAFALEVMGAGEGTGVTIAEPQRSTVMRWYFGFCGVWSPRRYFGESESIHANNFTLALTIDWNFYRFLGLYAGLDFANDWVATIAQEYRDFVLEVPFAIKGIFTPLTYMRLEPYAGLQLNLTLIGVTRPSILSWMAGFQYGIPIGSRGLAFIDARCSIDMFASTLETLATYQRTILRLGIGYKIGFFPR